MRTTLDKIAPGTSKKINLVLDYGAIALALWIAANQPEAQDLSRLTVLFGVAIVSWLVGTTIMRLYSPTVPRRRLDTVTLTGILVIGIMLVLSVAIRALGAAGPLQFDLLVFGELLLCSSIGTNIICSSLRHIDTPDDEEILIVGTGPLARATYDRLTNHVDPSKKVAGFLSFTGQPALLKGIGAPGLGSHADLESVLSQTPVSEVYIAGRVMQHGNEMQQVVKVCEEIGVPFAMPLHSLRFDRAQLFSSSASRDGYLHYLTTSSKPLQFAVKRLADIALSVIALGALSPLLIGTALAIRWGSKGPIFFRQARVGLHGTHFHLFKFRSMVVNADELKAKLAKQNEQSGPVFKMQNDPRVTGVGRFIRKYSIDELPQLINILRGDMTIVGPRPAVPAEVEQYKAWQRRRLSARPGLTCYWQVGGRNEIGFDEWMHLDLEYVDNWDLGVDIRLILKTVPVVLTGRGAS